MLYEIANDKPSSTSRVKLEKTLIDQNSQIANGIVTCSEIADSYIENSGFPNFMEVAR